MDPFETREIYLNDEIYYRLRHVHVNALAPQFGAILTELRKDEITDVREHSELNILGFV